MKYIFWIYQWFIVAPILLVATIITALTTIVGSFINGDYFGYYPAKWWSRLWCALLFVKVEVRGRENINRQEAYVFVANHQSAFDIFSIYGYLGHNFKWMMRKGLHNIPLIGTACERAGHIMVDTKSTKGIIHTIHDAQRRLVKGMSIVVFPEGRRTDTGHMAPFKRGAFMLASEFGLPIVPITIDGSYRVMPRSTFNVTPGRIVLSIHEPIMPVDGKHDCESAMQQSYESIQSSLPEDNA